MIAVLVDFILEFKGSMALQKCVPTADTPTAKIKTLSFTSKENGKGGLAVLHKKRTETESNIDLREVYFLIMHFLSAGPCLRTYGQLWNELLEHQLLPRRYHAWYSRSGMYSGDENDDGMSFPLNYSKLVERHPHIEQDHLVKLLKQLVLVSAAPSGGAIGGNVINAATVPTLLGAGSFSLLGNDESKKTNRMPPAYMRWPHSQADQVRGLRLREIGGGFARHHRAPSTRAACFAIIKPSIMFQKMQNIKRVRGHRNAVYCAIFDRSGRYVITGSDDRLVKVWSMETAYCLASCRGHEGDITDLAVNFNNTLVASSSNDFVIRVWRLPDGMPISVLRGHTGVVTAIAFSPRSNALYQLLSSSDDGSCRIWDARYSQFSPRIYVPKPSDSITIRANVLPSGTAPQNLQIFCCAFNASGTFFVSGSSDNLARVWNAYKTNPDDSDQPNHELDVLSGHENDVNYVQFSGCAVAARLSNSDFSKEECLPKFKNSWFNHDNIVTCSRDGSAIIWIPRSRRSHGKSGRWIRAYHLKVPPPPVPPLPPRGGPRQRIPPTPRGVNMIAWSLDNRFVLAAIMDCRICVWNAVDGSLVHSLTGHTDSTYVLDVHPFNPRIAMSAGYDGKTIVWDIWEGTPIRRYEIGQFKLVDGKFSPDGTSIILSDDVGQLYILNTGQGESQKDAKYDQFFLGDYRPLSQDTHGNVLDQETQLPPYRRNLQDLLCDSAMIPYPEPYQSMYQKRRLGVFGIEWRPSSERLSVGVDFSLDQDYMLPMIDLDAFVDPLPEFVDAMDWEPEVEIYSDDNDSEYHVTEDNSSGGEQVSLSSDSSVPDSCSENSADDSNPDVLRRSRRKTQKAGADITTSSGRLVKRKNLDGCDDNLIRKNCSKKSRNGRKTPRKKSSSKTSRPRRAAARNALHLFSRITGTSTDGEVNDSDGNSSESESTLQDSSCSSEESDTFLQNEWSEHSKGKEISSPVDVENTYPFPQSQSNDATKKRLIIKFPNRDYSKSELPQHEGLKCGENHLALAGSLSRASCENNGTNQSYSQEAECSIGGADGNIPQNNLSEHHSDYLGGCKDGSIRWGGVKMRTSKRLKSAESWLHINSSSVVDQHVKAENTLIGNSISLKEHEVKSTNSQLQNLDTTGEEFCSVDDNISRTALESSKRAENDGTKLELGEVKNGSESIDHFQNFDGQTTRPSAYANGNHYKLKDDSPPVPTKLQIRSVNLSKDQDGGRKFVLNPEEIIRTGANRENHSIKEDLDPANVYDDAGKLSSGKQDYNESEGQENASRSVVKNSLKSDSSKRMYSAVYSRLKVSRIRDNPEDDCDCMEASTSQTGMYKSGHDPEIAPEGIRRARTIRLRSTTCDSNVSGNNLKFTKTLDDSDDHSIDAEKAYARRGEDYSGEEWRSEPGTSGRLRASRRRKGSYYVRETSPADRRKSNQCGRSSWLMMSAHEEGSRYIPQLGDEIVYFRQGHHEYILQSNSRDAVPWETMKQSIKDVEFCRVENLEYSTHPGSGEGCCKMTLKFVSPSEVLGSFKLTLPEVTGFPDFLVERSRYDAAMLRNWTSRDKCRVWWKNEGDEDGSWWEGRILTVKSRSLEFPDSPWEKYVVKYKSDPTDTHHHSPWELFDVDTNCEHQHPHIEDAIRDELLHSFYKLEQSGYKAQDCYGVNKLKQVSQKTNFINRFPVPLTLELIQSRLENNYYRSLAAMKHDISVMLANAESFFGKNAELSLKMKRLSDWFRKTLLPC